MLTKALKLMVLLVFTVPAPSGAAPVQMPMTLALDEGSGMTIAVPGMGPGGPNSSSRPRWSSKAAVETSYDGQYRRSWASSATTSRSSAPS